MGLLGSALESPAEQGAALHALPVPLTCTLAIRPALPYLLHRAAMPLREDPVPPTPVTAQYRFTQGLLGMQ